MYGWRSQVRDIIWCHRSRLAAIRYLSCLIVVKGRIYCTIIGSVNGPVVTHPSFFGILPTACCLLTLKLNFPLLAGADWLWTAAAAHEVLALGGRMSGVCPQPWGSNPGPNSASGAQLDPGSFTTMLSALMTARTAAAAAHSLWELTGKHTRLLAVAIV